MAYLNIHIYITLHLQITAGIIYTCKRRRFAYLWDVTVNWQDLFVNLRYNLSFIKGGGHSIKAPHSA